MQARTVDAACSENRKRLTATVGRDRSAAMDVPIAVFDQGDVRLVVIIQVHVEQIGDVNTLCAEIGVNDSCMGITLRRLRQQQLRSWSAYLSVCTAMP